MANANINRQILLVSRPQGEASADNFRVVETPLAPLGEGRCACAITISRSIRTCADG